MIKFFLSLSFLLPLHVSAQNSADEYCKKLHEERDGFLNLVPPAEDKKLTPLLKEAIASGMSVDLLLAEANKRKLRMNKAEIAAYKRDFYNTNCKTQIEAQKISDGLPANEKYCAALSKIADEADRYQTNPSNISNNWSELHAISSAVYRDVTTEALDKMLSFEDYAKMVAAKSKAQGREITLGNFARAQYTQMFYQKYCVTEAQALVRPKTTLNSNTNPESAELKWPEFKPIQTQEASSARTSK